MKKMTFSILILAAVLTVCSAAPVYAHEKDMSMSGKGQGMGMMGGKMMDGKGMNDKMMGMHMMMKMMMNKTVVPTEDGGVVVVAGSKITKYDKNLKVVNQAQVDMDMEGMSGMMEEMMEHCPLMNGSESEEEEAAEQEAGGHEAHH